MWGANCLTSKTKNRERESEKLISHSVFQGNDLIGLRISHKASLSVMTNFVNLMQSKIPWEESVNDGLLRSGWLVRVSVGGYIDHHN